MEMKFIKGSMKSSIMSSMKKTGGFGMKKESMNENKGGKTDE
jgi:hypothetical protein